MQSSKAAGDSASSKELKPYRGVGGAGVRACTHSTSTWRMAAAATTTTSATHDTTTAAAPSPSYTARGARGGLGLATPLGWPAPVERWSGAGYGHGAGGGVGGGASGGGGGGGGAGAWTGVRFKSSVPVPRSDDEAPSASSPPPDPFALVAEDLDFLSRKMLNFVSNEVRVANCKKTLVGGEGFPQGHTRPVVVTRTVATRLVSARWAWGHTSESALADIP